MGRHADRPTRVWDHVRTRRLGTVIAVVSLAVATTLTGSASAAVWTDLYYYVSGDTVHIFGNEMEANEPVVVDVVLPDGSLGQEHVVDADDAGSFTDDYVMPENPPGGEYTITATGELSGRSFSTVFDPVTTTTSVNVAPTSAVVGQSITFSGGITKSAGTASALITDGTVSIAVYTSSGCHGLVAGAVADLPVTASADSPPAYQYSGSLSTLVAGTYYAKASYSGAGTGSNKLGTSDACSSAFTVIAPTTVTVNVSGTQTYGGSPTFTQTNNAPSGVNVTGTVSCTQVTPTTTITSTMTPGSYTLLGTSCSGLTLSDPTHYVLSYAGVTSGFVVSKRTITVHVSGSQTYGSSTPAFTQTNDDPASILTGSSSTLSCTKVGTSTSISSSLPAGSYTVLGSSCSGMGVSDSTDYALAYVGETDGFVVGKRTITLQVSGSQTYGSTTPTFTQTNDDPASVLTALGSLSCATVDSGTPIDDTLGAGNHTVDGSSCSGVGLSDSSNYALAYTGVTSGFVVSKQTLSVSVTGGQTYGGSPTFGFTTGAPSGLITGTNADLSCTKVATNVTITTTLTAGAYTVEGDSCSGLNLSDSSNYVLSYVGATDGFVVSKKPLTISVSGTKTYGVSDETFGQTNTDTDGVLTHLDDVSCTTVDGGTAIDNTLGAGNHTIDGSSCTGAVLTDTTNYSLSYAGVTNGFVVSKQAVTIHVSGTKTFGVSDTAFTNTVDGASGVLTTLSSLSCATVGSATAIDNTLPAGPYTVLGSSCSGVGLTDSDNYRIVYVGVSNGFVVAKQTVTIHVSGTKTFGVSDTAFTNTVDGASGVLTTLSSLTCTTVGSATAIDNTLPAGAYTVLGSSCSGVGLTDSNDYQIVYVGVTNGFVVAKRPITLTVSGTKTYGVSNSAFTQSNDGPTGTLNNLTDLNCTTVGSATTIDNTLPAGSYTVLGSSCTGVTLVDSDNYTLSYAGATNGFVVSKRPITVTVSGTKTFGVSNTAFTQTNDGPSGTLGNLGGLTCTTVGSATAIDNSLAAGAYTVLGSSCTGVTLTDSGNYSLSYAGNLNGFVVSTASTSVLYTGTQIVIQGNTVNLSATVSSPANACLNNRTVRFAIAPMGSSSTPTQIATGTTNSSGLTGNVAFNSTGFTAGMYDMYTTVDSNTNCDAAQAYESSFTIGSPGDAANGGGWYTSPGTGRINFGFTVSKVPNTTNQYKGQLLLINNGKWRLKGSLSDYVKAGATSKSGSSSGTGTLQWWNSSLNGGLGDWAVAATPVSFTASFTDGGTGKNTTDAFGISIQYAPVSPQPSTMPNSAQTQLKGGDVKVA